MWEVYVHIFLIIDVLYYMHVTETLTAPVGANDMQRVKTITSSLQYRHQQTTFIIRIINTVVIG